MNIFDQYADFCPERSVVTIGTFDGVHLGHRRILFALRRLARQLNSDMGVITFYPHPRKALYQDSNVHNLTSLNEKIKLFRKLGVEHLMLLHFTPELSGLSAKGFLQEIIMERMRPAHIVMGYDHAFGKGRKGDFAFMEQKSLRYGFGLSRVGPREIAGKPVSSSRLRYVLSQGSLKWGHRLLGRRYSLRGRVVRGEGRGGDLGFPTANLELDDSDKLLPPDGVYDAITYFPKEAQSYRSLVNIGDNPTFAGGKRIVESHILSFAGDIYGRTVEIILLDYLRSEIRFHSVEELVEQMKCDRAQVQERPFVETNALPDSWLKGIRLHLSQSISELDLP